MGTFLDGQVRRRITLLAVAVLSALMVSALASGRARADSTPTLGAAGALGTTTGFGAAEPGQIDLGGDGTTVIEGVHWDSWGGSRATGTGLADWVWPGWCMACGSDTLTATVVAYDLASCNGQQVYEEVEWYFPTRGQTFSPVLASDNLCTGKQNNAAADFPSRNCASFTLNSGGHSYRVSALSSSNYGRAPGCQLVRSTVSFVAPVRHYRHNAKWHAGRWWCGSQLVMSNGYPPAQSMECVRGDWETIDFTLASS